MNTPHASHDELFAHFSRRAVTHDALDDDVPHRGMERTLMREVLAAGLKLAPPDDAPVTPADLRALPEAEPAPALLLRLPAAEPALLALLPPRR